MCVQELVAKFYFLQANFINTMSFIDKVCCCRCSGLRTRLWVAGNGEGEDCVGQPSRTEGQS